MASTESRLAELKEGFPVDIPEKIQAVLNANLVDEDGDAYETRLLSPMESAEIADLEEHLGFALPEPTRALLEFARGIDNTALEHIDFVGESVEYYSRVGAAMNFREIAQDGLGNSWFYDFDASSKDLGPVYYYMQDGPVVVYQSRDIHEFVDEALRIMMPPYQSALDDVHEFRSKTLDDLNRDLMPREHALKAEDPLLQAFASEFTGDVFFYDFRQAKPGDGFDAEHLRVVARHPEAPIYVLEATHSFLETLMSFFKK